MLSRNPDFKTTSQFDRGYTPGGQKSDITLGSYTLLTAPAPTAPVAQITRLYTDKNDLLREIETLRRRLALNSPHLLNFLDYSVEVKRNWCANMYNLNLFYEVPFKNLRREIVDRRSKTPRQYFSNKELTFLLYHITFAGAYLQENGVVHSDINPTCVYVEKGAFKLGIKPNVTGNPYRAQVEKMMKGEAVYCSPAVYPCAKKNKLDQLKHDPFRSDTFAFGLVLLEAATLQPVQGVYGEGESMDAPKVRELLDEARSRNADNTLLVTTIANLLELEERNRHDFVSLRGRLPDFQEVTNYFNQRGGIPGSGRNVTESRDRSKKSQNFANNTFYQDYLNGKFDTTVASFDGKEALRGVSIPKNGRRGSYTSDLDMSGFARDTSRGKMINVYGAPVEAQVDLSGGSSPVGLDPSKPSTAIARPSQIPPAEDSKRFRRMMLTPQNELKSKDQGRASIRQVNTLPITSLDNRRDGQGSRTPRDGGSFPGGNSAVAESYGIDSGNPPIARKYTQEFQTGATNSRMTSPMPHPGPLSADNDDDFFTKDSLRHMGDRRVLGSNQPMSMPHIRDTTPQNTSGYLDARNASGLDLSRHTSIRVAPAIFVDKKPSIRVFDNPQQRPSVTGETGYILNSVRTHDANPTSYNRWPQPSQTGGLGGTMRPLELSRQAVSHNAPSRRTVDVFTQPSTAPSHPSANFFEDANQKFFGSFQNNPLPGSNLPSPHARTTVTTTHITQMGLRIPQATYQQVRGPVPQGATPVKLYQPSNFFDVR